MRLSFRIALIQKLVERRWQRLNAERAAEQVSGLYQRGGDVPEPWTVKLVGGLYRVARDEDEMSVYDDENKPRAQDVRDMLNEMGV